MTTKMNGLRKLRSLGRSVALMALLLVSGCSALNAADLLTAGPEQKQKTLGERVTKFHRELYWGTGTEFASFIEPTKRSQLTRQFRQAQELEKLVDLEVRAIELNPEDSNKADVDVKVKFYKKSSLQVSERFEKESWVYYPLHGGWFLMNREIEPLDEVG